MAAGQLEFIKQTTVTSSTTNLAVTDCFSADYTNYKIQLEQNSLSQEASLETRVINGSGVVSASQYDLAMLSMRSSDSVASETKSVDNDKWQYTMYGEGTNGGFYIATLFNPFASDKYTSIQVQMQSQYVHTSPTHRDQTRHLYGVYTVAESITGISVHTTNSAINNATLTVWGYK